METKISKAQQEVWEWKEKAYQEMKDLTISEQIKLIHEQIKPLIDRISKKKQKHSH